MGHAYGHEQQPDYKSDDLQYDAYHAANLSCLRHALAGAVHSSGGHFSQVVVSHDPRDDAADEAAYEAKDPEGQNEPAAMRRQRLRWG